MLVIEQLTVARQSLERRAGHRHEHDRPCHHGPEKLPTVLDLRSDHRPGHDIAPPSHDGVHLIRDGLLVDDQPRRAFGGSDGFTECITFPLSGVQPRRQDVQQFAVLHRPNQIADFRD